MHVTGGRVSVHHQAQHHTPSRLGLKGYTATTTRILRQLVADRLDQRMTTPVDETPDRQGLRQIYEKKGALVYAMLHDLLGDQAFQHFLLLLAEAGGQITSADVRRAAEAVSGRDLHWFFQQWVSDGRR